jgi:hypothetical protein
VRRYQLSGEGVNAARRVTRAARTSRDEIMCGRVNDPLSSRCAVPHLRAW